MIVLVPQRDGAGWCTVVQSASSHLKRSKYKTHGTCGDMKIVELRSPSPMIEMVDTLVEDMRKNRLINSIVTVN